MNARKQASIAAQIESTIATTAAARADVPIAVVDASTVASRLTPEIMREVVGPALQSANNAEPWYQSFVIVGSMVTLVAGTYGLVLDFADGTLPTVEALTPQLGAIFGAGVALYGRLFATRPLGR